MAVNSTMTVNQAAAVLNAVVAQATGQTDIANVATGDFVSVAQTALKTGVDPILGAMSQVLSRTIFSMRPYSAQYKGLEVGQEAYGNHVRKLSIADQDWTNDKGYTSTVDGSATDMFIVKKPDILQTNFYSKNTFQDYYTIHREQYNVSLTSPAEFANFVSMVTSNMSDRLEQAREEISRATIANFIGGILAEGQTSRVVHLLSEYNALTGGTYNTQTIYLPENFTQFMQFVYSRFMTVSDRMRQRSQLYQTVVNEKKIMRHTPKEEQRLYLYSPAVYNSETMAIANTFDSKWLSFGDYEAVPFWQSIETPDSISVTPQYIGSDGTVQTGAAQEQAGIFGLLTDREAMGYAEFDQDITATPYNAAGRYTNYWIHDTFRCWNDHTEKGVVFLLD